jgi:dipeptide/tripeptide permease
MGTWFLGLSIGNYLAGRAAQLSASHGYGVLFGTLIIASLVIAGALFFVAPMIRRMMDGDSPAELPKAIAKSKAEDAAPAGTRAP